MFRSPRQRRGVFPTHSFFDRLYEKYIHTRYTRGSLPLATSERESGNGCHWTVSRPFPTVPKMEHWTVRVLPSRRGALPLLQHLRCGFWGLAMSHPASSFLPSLSSSIFILRFIIRLCRPIQVEESRQAGQRDRDPRSQHSLHFQLVQHIRRVEPVYLRSPPVDTHERRERSRNRIVFSCLPPIPMLRYLSRGCPRSSQVATPSRTDLRYTDTSSRMSLLCSPPFYLVANVLSSHGACDTD